MKTYWEHDISEMITPIFFLWCHFPGWPAGRSCHWRQSHAAAGFKGAARARRRDSRPEVHFWATRRTCAVRSFDAGHSLSDTDASLSSYTPWHRMSPSNASYTDAHPLGSPPPEYHRRWLDRPYQPPMSFMTTLVHQLMPRTPSIIKFYKNCPKIGHPKNCLLSAFDFSAVWQR